MDRLGLVFRCWLNRSERLKLTVATAGCYSNCSPSVCVHVVWDGVGFHGKAESLRRFRGNSACAGGKLQLTSGEKWFSPLRAGSVRNPTSVICIPFVFLFFFAVQQIIICHTSTEHVCHSDQAETGWV